MEMTLKELIASLTAQTQLLQNNFEQYGNVVIDVNKLSDNTHWQINADSARAILVPMGGNKNKGIDLTGYFNLINPEVGNLKKIQCPHCKEVIEVSLK